MKKLLGMILAVVMTVIVGISLVACDETSAGINKVYVDDSGKIIVEFTDGTIKDYGKAEIKGEVSGKTIAKTSVNEEKHFIVEYSDGTSEDLGYVGVGIQPEQPKTVINTYVNQEKHLIIEYSDETSEDLGYVGVEIPPQKITITFVDYNDRVISTEETYVGLTIKAPANPEREDYIFSGWDKDLTNITESTTVKATYTAKQGYIVTFVDYDDTVLKTETVISGKSATPPANPTRENYKFSGWDGDYTNVTSNRTIKAKYSEKGSYIVTFKDYNGLTLGTDTVKEGENATAPITPTRDGYTFKGWSSSINNVTSNKIVEAQYTLINADNVFDISYKVSGNTVTVTLSLAGDVCLAGFEGTLAFNGMTLTNATAKSNYVLINTNGNTITMTYSNATNITKGETVLTAKLTIGADNGTAVLNITDCFDQNFDNANYKVIGQDLKLR